MTALINQASFLRGVYFLRVVYFSCKKRLLKVKTIRVSVNAPLRFTSFVRHRVSAVKFTRKLFDTFVR